MIKDRWTTFLAHTIGYTIFLSVYITTILLGGCLNIGIAYVGKTLLSLLFFRRVI